MIDESILPVIRTRLENLLAPPREFYRPLRVDGVVAGWLNDARAARLVQFAEVFELRSGEIVFVPALATQEARTRALAAVASRLAAAGLLTAWRSEPYAVAPTLGAPPLFLVERAAARFFGIRTYAVHVNGLVRAGNRCDMWIARRSPSKAIDPGRLDNLVGGGVAAGVTVAATLEKEAWEEAGIDAVLARQAIATGPVHICRTQPDGLHCETVFTHDLWLAPGYAPTPMDGEAVAHRCLPLAAAAQLIAIDEGPDAVTADASLVILDCLIRHGAIAPDAADYLALDALRHPPLTPAARERRT